MEGKFISCAYNVIGSIISTECDKVKGGAITICLPTKNEETFNSTNLITILKHSLYTISSIARLYAKQIDLALLRLI